MTEDLSFGQGTLSIQDPETGEFRRVADMRGLDFGEGVARGGIQVGVHGVLRVQFEDVRITSTGTRHSPVQPPEKPVGMSRQAWRALQRRRRKNHGH